MSSKNKSFSLEEASVLLQKVEEFYPIFYQDSEEDLKIFKLKAYNSKNEFWDKLKTDTENFISKDFEYSGSRIFQFFKASEAPSNPYVRKFKVEDIECLRELVLTYETCVYDIKTKQPVFKRKNPSNKNPEKRFSTKQILYSLICIAIITAVLLIKNCSSTPDKKEKQKPTIIKKVLDTTKIKKDSLPKNINNMNIHIQVKDSGKIEQINNFNNVKEVSL